MDRPLMPRATALWLIHHTSLTWEQIGYFCHIHPFEVSLLADERGNLQELNPIANNQLTIEEIHRCQNDPTQHLMLNKNTIEIKKKKTNRRYIPLCKRTQVPNAIFWVIRHYPYVPDKNIVTLFSTTKTMVSNIRQGSHRLMNQILPKNPVSLQLCSQEDLQHLEEIHLFEKDKITKQEV